jgi:Fe-S-cluster containining protein
MTSVPCNGCTACCRTDTIFLVPGDDPDQYETVIVNEVSQPPVRALKRQPNGHCIYLGESGCTIHERAPKLCRAFDCRAFFKRHTRQQRRAILKENSAGREVFEAGRKRLHTL